MRSSSKRASILHALGLTLLLSKAVFISAAADITVFAAASLTDVLKEIGNTYQTPSKNKVLFNFAASSTLARQIQAGAPADIFFSADESNMDALARDHLIDEKTRRSRLSNALVIIVAAEDGAAVEGPGDLTTPKVKRLALAEPQTVPAGMYAREYLRKQKLWEAVEAKVIPTANVRAALSTVASGNADAAIVYRTDAAMSDKVKVVWEMPAQDSPEIRYPLAVLRGSKQPEVAGKFLEHLCSDQAAKIFEKYGFVVLRPTP